MAVESTGAKLIKEEKKSLLPKSFSNKEISLVFALVIVAVAGLSLYFVLLPMFTNLSKLNGDIDILKAQEVEHRNQIAQLENFQEMYDKAKSDYNKYVAYFYGPMVPELIDERVTGMVIANDMTPATLTMTLLRIESVPLYVAKELRVSPVPVPIGDLEAGDAREDDAAAEEDDPAAEADEDEDECYAFEYTVSVSAYGERENLYAFLAQAAPMTALEVTSFVYDKGNTGDGASQNVIEIELKLYVFVEGVAPADEFSRR